MSVISSIVGRGSEALADFGVDPLLLTSEERAGAHFTAETASGRVVRVSLPRGTELHDGDVLLTEGQWAVVVRAAEEDLILVKPAGSSVEWWAACYQLGNLHRPARFTDEGILTPYDPLAAQVLSGLDVSIERTRRPFVGRRFGSAGAHHHHHGEEGSPHNEAHVHAIDAGADHHASDRHEHDVRGD
jgi:urease accessory protein